MSTITNSYNIVYSALKRHYDAIIQAEASASAASAGYSADIDAKIAEYTEQIKNIDVTLPQIEDLLLLVQPYIKNRNLPIITAPEGYLVNVNRLKSWSKLIDPMLKDSHPDEEPGDPYAQRIYMVGSCDVHFLKKKRSEFTAAIEDLQKSKTEKEKLYSKELKEAISQANEAMSAYLASEQFLSFAREVAVYHRDHSYPTLPEKYGNASTASSVALGKYKLLLPVPAGEQRKKIAAILGAEVYDPESSTVTLPYELGTTSETAVCIRCETAKTTEMDSGLQNLLLDIIERSPAGSNKIHIFDCARFKSTALGVLKALEDSPAIAPIPRNTEQVSAALEQLIADIDDKDDVIDSFDTLIEYNNSVAPEKRLPRTTLLLIGWPNSFKSEDAERIRRIMVNYERYGVSFIAVNFGRAGREKHESGGILPDYVEQRAIQLRVTAVGTTLTDENETAYPFQWYKIGTKLEESYVKSLKACAVEKKKLGNDYTKRFDMVSLPRYIQPDTADYSARKYRKLELPFGIDGRDEVQYLSFENENFAAFLMGASRSGKSTMLHTLISGILRQFHPDNVELWLADFKQLEFKKYMDPCPPHVKYILLDESQELVFDLIDKLTEKMLERQRLFSKEGKERIDQIDVTQQPQPLPLIFVILDEFSIMSQAVAESDVYRLRLQNLLAKGAALGIRFLFSSQTFTTGVSGLTTTARAQIQQRIAMKGRRDEIEETLELSAALKTEKVKSWMDALPPHYALIKRSMGPDIPPEVNRVYGLYFPDARVRDNYITNINSHMHPTEKYTPEDNSSYVDKHPVLVDGGTYYSFKAERIRGMIDEYRHSNADDISAEDVVLTLGVPRRMSKAEFMTMTNESRENMLLVAPPSETACAMSLIWTVAETFRLQGGQVYIWAHHRNRIYRSYRKSHFAGCRVSEGMEEICDSVRELHAAVVAQKPMNAIIIMLGMDQICNDFELVEEGGSAKAAQDMNKVTKDLKNVEVKTAEEQAQVDLIKEFNETYDQDAILEKLIEEGKSDEEIEQYFDHLMDAFLESRRPSAEAAPAGVKAPAQPEETEAMEEEAEVKTGIYNAYDDIAYILRHGSRFGLHSLVCINNIEDARGTPFRETLFRHRVAFQMSRDDSYQLFGSNVAASLPERICEYTDGIDRYSLRPFIHEGIGWDGWHTDKNGEAMDRPPKKETN